ncbi:hypothetical protein J6590_026515 [Homalodisca vitripennis]|nr:hypothetical protein J6590_026515 [Homalodisca vitripennis]
METPNCFGPSTKMICISFLTPISNVVLCDEAMNNYRESHGHCNEGVLCRTGLCFNRRWIDGAANLSSS